MWGWKKDGWKSGAADAAPGPIDPSEGSSPEAARRATHICATLEGLGVQIPWLGVKGTAREGGWLGLALGGMNAGGRIKRGLPTIVESLKDVTGSHGLHRASTLRERAERGRWLGAMRDRSRGQCMPIGGSIKSGKKFQGLTLPGLVAGRNTEASTDNARLNWR
jgi:hypothetical protein